MAPKPKQKAAMRGVLHHYAAFPASVAGLLLTLDSPPGPLRWGCAIYSLSLVAMFSISAAYHRPHWEPGPRNLMRKLDHCAIYGLIAGTYTPLCLAALDAATSRRLLVLVWAGAFAGIAQSLLSGNSFSSKARSALLYVLLGWIVVLYWTDIRQILGSEGAALLAAGGVTYSLGAVVYATKFPNPVPQTFGYHEVFHAAVILASIFQFIAVRLVVRRTASLAAK